MERFKTLASKAHDKAEKHWHKAFLGAHVSYFSAAFLEGHGLYAGLAGGLGAMLLIGAIFKLGE